MRAKEFTMTHRAKWAIAAGVAAIIVIAAVHVRLDLWIGGKLNGKAGAEGQYGITATTKGVGSTSTGPTSISGVVTSRPAQWAKPLAAPGLSNFYKVTDGLYRGAQPTAEGFKQLEAMGIKTVVNLRSLHSDKDLAAGAKLTLKEIPSMAIHPEDEDMVAFLKIVTDPTRQPVFVHCQHGSDRTGTACAVFRLTVQGWTKEQALAEMEYGGYGFHEEFVNLLQYIRQLDVGKIKRLAGL